MGCFNDPAWKVCGWWGGGGGWLTPTTYIQLAGAGSTKEQSLLCSLYKTDIKLISAGFASSWISIN